MKGNGTYINCFNSFVELLKLLLSCCCEFVPQSQYFQCFHIGVNDPLNISHADTSTATFRWEQFRVFSSTDRITL